MAYSSKTMLLLLSVLVSNRALAQSSDIQSERSSPPNPEPPQTTPPLSQPFQCFSLFPAVKDGSQNRTAVPAVVNESVTNVTVGARACFHNETSTTQRPSQPVSRTYDVWLEDLLQKAILASWYFRVVVFPIVGILGLAGNILSFLVLVRSGLAKPSNVFLLGLAVADSFCLLGAVNIATIIRYTPKSLPFGFWMWEFSIYSSFVCFVFATTFECLSSYGLYVSAGLCVAITIERLLAVYLPLQFAAIVTPTRAWIVCSSIFIFWIPYLVFTGISWYRFDYTYRPFLGMAGGDMLIDVTNIILDLDYYFAAVFGKFIPLAIVIIGSFLISIKVTMTLKRRQKMVSSSSAKPGSSGSRTTTTMLMVCAVFSVAKIVTLPSYAIERTDTYMSIMSIYLGNCILLCDFINSSCNFLIYVLFNNKFRLVLVECFSAKKGLSLKATKELSVQDYD